MKLIRTIRILTLASFLAASLPVFAIDSANDPEYLYSKAMMLKTQKDYAQAIEILNKLIPEGKQLDHIYYQIASCYMSQTDYQQAIAYARKSIDANGKYLEPYQLIFDIYMTLKNYDEAIEILNQLLDEDPSQIQSWYTLGVVYSQNAQNNQLAAYCFRKVLEIAQKTAVPAFYKEQSSLILAEIYYGNKEYRTAISYLDDAVKINPHNSIRYYRFASNLLSLDMLDSARICIENFLENLPESQKRAPFIKDFYAFLGNLYYISENPQANYYLRLGSGTENIDRYAAQQIFQLTAAHDNQAEQTLEKITAEYPRYASPYVALGRIHRDRGEIDAAYDSFMRAGSILIKTDMESATVSCFLEAHKLKPNEPDPIITLAQLYEQMKDMNLAILYYTMYQEKKPDIELLIHLGYLYDSIENRKKSDSYFAKAVAENPAYARTYFIEGMIASRDNHNKEAEALIQKAIDIKKDDPLFFYQLAVAQEQQKKYSDSIESLKKAIALDNDNASYQNFLGYLYADTNTNLDEAYTLIDKALSKDPSNGAYLDSMGWVLYRQGKYDLAMTKLQRARRILEAGGEPDPVVYEHIGDTYLKQEKRMKAITFWKWALENSKKDGYLDDKSVQKKIRAAEKE